MAQNNVITNDVEKVIIVFIVLCKLKIYKSVVNKIWTVWLKIYM